MIKSHFKSRWVILVALSIACTTQTTLGATVESANCEAFNLSKMPFDFGTQKLPGGILLAHKKDLVCKSAAGIARLDSNDKMDANIRFPIASNTKMFTAFTILELAREGKIRMTAPVSEYLTDAEKFLLTAKDGSAIEGITVEDLIRHSSGLKDYLSDAEEAYSLETDQNTIGSAFEIVKAVSLPDFKIESLQEDMSYFAATWKKHLGERLYFNPMFALAYSRIHGLFKSNLFKPGSDIHYSNTDFLLLGLIIENIEKSTVAEVFQKRIISKLNLKDTFEIGSAEHENYLVPFTPYYEKIAFTRYFSGMVGYTDDGLVSTLEELDAFVRQMGEYETKHRGVPFLGKTIFEKYHFKRPTEKGVLYGPGMMKKDVQTKTGPTPMYYHTGEDPGVLSVAAYLPKCHGSSFVAMVNQASKAGALELLGDSSKGIDGIVEVVVRKLCE